MIIIVILFLKLLMFYVYVVCISVTCRFQFLYTLISNCHSIQISYKDIILIKKANYSLELVLFIIQNLCNPTLAICNQMHI